MSKAALNMMTITMAKEFEMNGDNVSAQALNPSFVTTRLTPGRFCDDRDECIAGIVNAIEKAGKEHSRQFLSWNDETLPW